jgi:cation:H+ antiporter
MWLLTLGTLAAGFVLLIKGADLLVDGASSIARRLGVSQLAIGLTVVAFGTSLPELSVNILASARGNTGIAIGNVVGSNIANILLILGISALIAPLSAGKGTVFKEIPFSLLAAAVLAIQANDAILDHAAQSVVSRSDALVFLCFFSVFLYYTASIATAGGEIPGEPEARERAPWKSGGMIAVGLCALVLGGDFIVRAAVTISAALGMSESVIGLTVVAVGTSLPELATSAMAAYRGNSDIAVGNVVGSNIFNIFFILGVSGCIRPLPFTQANNLDLAVTMAASMFLFLSMFTGKARRIDRWEGALFVAMYAAYVAWLVLGVG